MTELTHQPEKMLLQLLDVKPSELFSALLQKCDEPARMMDSLLATAIGSEQSSATNATQRAVSLLERKADASAPGLIARALQKHATTGALFKALVAAGARARPDDVWVALAENASEEVLATLMTAANVHLEARDPRTNATPLLAAAAVPHSRTLDWLIKRKADVQATARAPAITVESKERSRDSKGADEQGDVDRKSTRLNSSHT